jgi:hypothetical protein
LPRVAQALSSSEISYQSAAVARHFPDKLRKDLRPGIDEKWTRGVDPDLHNSNTGVFSGPRLRLPEHDQM